MNILKPENYIDKINSYTKQDWKPILDLIPEIEKVEKFGKISKRAEKLIERGIIDMHPYVEYKIVEEFRQVCYAVPIIIDFDWDSWEEGREIVSDNDFDYDSIDIPTKCKIITAIVRNDRFCDGVLISYFESGVMLKVLKSIEKQLGFES
jgi:hypothetical protein